MKRPWEYPFGTPTEEEVSTRGDAVEGRPIGVPGSYDPGSSARWSPESIANVHAMSQLGRYQLRGYTTFNHRMPSFDDLVFVPATLTRLPLEGYRERCETDTVRRFRRGPGITDSSSPKKGFETFLVTAEPCAYPMRGSLRLRGMFSAWF